MKTFFLWCFSAASILLADYSEAKDIWKKINVRPGSYEVRVGDDNKTIHPSCALGEPYSFYVKPGKNKKLMVYFNSGGACWNDNTCAIIPNTRPVYKPSAEESNNPNLMGGMLDVNNPNNPYKDYSMVFVSYCTGDVHIGSKNQTYQSPIPPNNNFTIHHRGFDNFLYVMDYVRRHRDNKHPHEKVLVSGSSSGSYGAAINFPWVKTVLGNKSKYYLVGDSGIGVVSNDFLDTVLGPTSNWNVEENLHPVVSSLATVDATNFMTETYNLLGAEYPADKFAQYTTAYDVIQIFFWDVMLHPNPLDWGLGLSDPSFIGAWDIEMNTITGGLRNTLANNYRSYIDQGCNHTILGFNEFYSSSVENLSFRQWITAMTGEKNAPEHNWQNLSCTPGVNCGENNLTSDGINACLFRTFSAP
jgi:hypothetical protein